MSRRDIFRAAIVVIIIGFAMSGGTGRAADPPCDKYPPVKQPRCAEIWNELNKQDGPLIAQFGLDQQKRRDERGRSTASSISPKI